MSIDTSRLVACLEEFLFRTPKDVAAEPLSFEGLRGHTIPIKMPLANLVGVRGPGVAVPDASITAVFDEFQNRRLPFRWLVGPNSPDGFGKRLEAYGMHRVVEFSGLALVDLGREVPAPDGVIVREIEADDPDCRATFEDLLRRAFGMSPQTVTFLSKFCYFAGPAVRARNYLAFVEGVDQPVGVASSLYEPQDPIVLLAGSAVLPEYRGRGVYRALVRQRLRDVQLEGIEAAILQAIRTTSAPICRALGFEEVCAQMLYGWDPGS